MRVTEKMLKAQVDTLNGMLSLTEGEPNSYELDIANGGYAIDQICNNGRGVSNVIPRGTKREVSERLQSFMEGIRVGRNL